MTVKEASAKVNVSSQSGKYYYAKYLEDPNHNIPIPQLHPSFTQDQKSGFIGYIINDKMTITAASKKAKIKETTARIYYHRYFKVLNPDIVTPNHIITRKQYTQGQIKELIGYIVNGEMSVKDASRKANMDRLVAARYYRQYLKDNNIEHPVTKKTYTQDQTNKLIGYIFDDKTTMTAAAKKANITCACAIIYRRQYLKDHHLDIPQKHITQDQINQLIGYIVDNKMSMLAAAKKANMSNTTGYKYYHRYLNNEKYDVPTPKHLTQDKIDEFIDYVADDKMSIAAASKKVNMSHTSGYKYYRKYLKNQKRDVPT
jgi:transposase